MENAVDGYQVPLGGAVVVIGVVIVAMVTWMESAVQSVGGVVLFSFPLFKKYFESTRFFVFIISIS